MQAVRDDASVAPVRRRRWWPMVVALVLLLAGYALALTWATRWLEADLQRSLHPLPATQRDARSGE